MNILVTALEQSLIMLPLILGMYISYRILKITDLTVDGTYVLGAAVFARTIHFGLFYALIFAVIAGGINGSIVSFMQKNKRINGLIAGILANFMLYSVNLQIMQRPNISILGMPTLLSILHLENWLVPLIIINCFIIFIVLILLKGNLGLFLRAFGFNKDLLIDLGKPAELYRMLGLSISNGLAALTGTLSAQVNGFADINMGYGVALVGIGAIIIGRQIFLSNINNFNAFKEMFSCFIGILFYFISLSILLRIGVDPINLKLILGIVLFISLSSVKREDL
ncbi:ABC transporter permease [Rickettsia typhi]|uniref:ABC transporter permease protein n=2 Tax=Rickettsia typhi TaxID=785 RepID=Q68X07_RICTY|nr:ABC transporter permease [Rickettsia typhi]AAU03835.1 ABC transporter permease protein [Rickettsia typhi str. Wilmington]AFE54213.1 ABC transporter permease protein [Rickettsia typhi str. TH1527]AFE55053.1 ABC transporter permease protein [Rickettsia typhi str. B9991CWPP]